MQRIRAQKNGVNEFTEMWGKRVGFSARTDGASLRQTERRSPMNFATQLQILHNRQKFGIAFPRR
jgi:hypothetical protein